MKKRYGSTLGFLFCTLAIMFALLFVSFPKLDKNMANAEEVNPTAEIVEEHKNNEVLTKEIFEKNESFTNYQLESTITSYEIIPSGVELEELLRVNNTLELSIIDNVANEYIEFNTYFDNGEYSKNKLFTYLKGNKIFTSFYSKEDAEFNSVIYAYEHELISEKEYENAYAEFSRRDIEERITTVYRSEDAIPKLLANTLAESDADTYVEGSIYWQYDDKDRWNLHPLANMKVELYDYNPVGSNKLLGETYTDLNGEYFFSFKNNTAITEKGYDVFIRVYPNGRTFEVGKTWWTSARPYYHETTRRQDVATGSTTIISFDILYNEDNIQNCSFFVAQGLAVAEAVAKEFTGDYFDEKVKVWFPMVPTSISNFIDWINDTFSQTFNNLTKLEASFCYKTCMMLEAQEFNQWDVVMHEYGHFIEYKMGTMGINLVEYVVNNPSHRWNENAIEKHKDNKAYALELVWTEAWSTVFAEIAQQYYNSNFYAISQIPNVCDEKDRTCLIYSDARTYLGGEANEAAVAGFLYELYDEKTKVEVHDNISLSAKMWWSCTTASGLYTFSDFVNYFYEHNIYGNLKKDFALLLEYYYFGPQDFKVLGLPVSGNTILSSNTITFSWAANNLYHSLATSLTESYRVVIYDYLGRQIWQSELLTAKTYTLSSSDYDKIQKALDYQAADIYFGVLGYTDSNSVHTGPYLSKLKSYNAILPFFVGNSIPYSKFVGSTSFGRWKTYYVKFAQSGSFVFQTFGIQDTRMELYDDNGLIANDDDSGYNKNAFISCNVDASQLYRIKIRFKSILTSDSFKVGIITVSNESNYSNIFPLTEGQKHFITVPARQSLVFTFTTSIAEKKSIKMVPTNGPNYSGLYVIDPRSSKLTDRSSLGIFSTINITLDAGIPYLIIAFQGIHNYSGGVYMILVQTYKETSA